MQGGIGLPNTLEETDRDLVLEFARRADDGSFTSIGVFDRLVYEILTHDRMRRPVCPGLAVTSYRRSDDGTRGCSCPPPETWVSPAS